MDYKTLFSPFKINSMEIKNRVVMGPMGTSLCDEESRPTQRLADYYEERARGGVGLIIVEHAYPQKIGIKSKLSAGLWDETTIPGWKNVVDAMHRHGAKCAIEIGHLGRCTDYPSSIGQDAMAPSAVRCPVAQAPTREIEVSEIEQYKEDYIKSVRIAIAAGFDAIELHFANGYFLAEWLSGRTNKRTDEYGGTFENRVRFALELTRLVRKEVGPDYPLLARFASREVNGGRDIEESRVFARLLQDAGVDCIDINSGSPNEYDWEFPSYFQQTGFVLNDCEQIKKSVSIPVIGGGRVVEPKMAELALEDGRVDLISINRALIADPYWLEKARTGNEDKIHRCVACTACINEKEKQKGIVCTVNPFAGKEGRLKITKADAPKNILVVGGGPAGLQAAVIAAKRGHKVTLAEKDHTLGGMVRAAGTPPMKWDILSIIPELAAEARALGVEIKTDCEMTVDSIASGGFSDVILTTGLKPVIPRFEYDDESIPKCTAVDVLLGKTWIGNNVAIIGGGMVGCETAEFIAEYKKNVTIFEMNDKLAQDSYWNIRDNIMRKLDYHHVKMLSSVTVKELKDGCVIINNNSNEESYGPFDTVVLAAGLATVTSMEEEIKAKGINCISIEPKRIGSQIQQLLVDAVEATINF